MLYEPVEIGSGSPPAVKAILTYTGKVDMFCLECRQSATFEGQLSVETQNSIASELMASKSFGFASGFWTQEIFSKQLKCTRADHLLSFYFHIVDGKLRKVGQYPALTDIHCGEMAAFSNVLGEQGCGYLDKATTLAAQQHYLGAFTYLKKLMSLLLDKISMHAGLGSGNYMSSLPMADPNQTLFMHNMPGLMSRLQHLAKYLPPYVTEHLDELRVLDHDIDDLTEATCKNSFHATRMHLLFLIDQQLAQQQYTLRLKEAQSDD